MILSKYAIGLGVISVVMLLMFLTQENKFTKNIFLHMSISTLIGSLILNTLLTF